MSLLNIWKDRLIDVSGRNPLLNLRFVTREGKPRTNFVELLDLAEYDAYKLLAGKALSLDAKIRTHLDVPVRKTGEKDSLEPEESRIDYLEPVIKEQAEPLLSISLDLVNGGLPLSYLETDAPSIPNQPVPDYWQKHLDKLKAHQGDWNLAQRYRVLNNLRNKDRTAEEEMGLNVLFLTWGLLKWRLKEKDEWSWSPLFLIPMDLDRQGVAEPKYTLKLDEDEPIVFNPTLRLYLQQQFGMDLSGIPERFEEESPSEDELNKHLTALSELIKERPDWEIVTHRPVLAIFHFANLILYREIEAWGEEMASHPLISRFLNHDLLLQADFRDARDIDRSLAPQESFQVIDADSSQQEAIQAARDGISFVLDGPPGTGKSQTIVNIISELVSQGKKVLFVSQKKAALDVVRYRMEINGIGHLCLDLHDHRQSNKAFIESLASAQLTLEQPLPVAPNEGLFNRLAQTRQQLNAYSDALHSRPGKLEESVHALYAACSQSYGAIPLSFEYNQPLDVDEHRLADIQEAIQALGRQASIHLAADAHPWREFRTEKALTMGERERFSQSFSHLQQILSQLENLSKDWSELTGTTISESLAGVKAQAALRRELEAIPDLPSAWCEGETEPHRERLHQDREAHKASQLAWDELMQFAREDVSTRDLELLQDSTTKYQKMGFFRVLMPAFYSWKKRLLQDFYQAQAGQSDPERVSKDIDQYRSLIKERQDLLAQIRDYASRYQGFETDWQALETELDWLANLISMQPLNPTLKQLLVKPQAKNELLRIQQQLQSLISEAETEIAVLNKYWRTDALPSGWDAQIQALAAQESELGRLDEWTSFVRLRQELVQLGLSDFMQKSRQQLLPAEQLTEAFNQRFFKLSLDASEQELPVLLNFDSIEHQRRIEIFSGLDRDQLPLNRERVLYRHHQAYLQNQSKIPTAQLSTLRKLAAQKRPRKRIRWIVRELRELMLNVYPCWMMSPLSVAQFIELEKGQETMLFDTVIFDEASQIYPEDGLSSIFRGKQLIVAGDPLQMPPTSVARSFMEVDESDDDEVGSDYESVLDLASTVLRRRRLMWHYRSRFEELINPSNYHIYDGDLITFPRAELPEDYPVEFHYVADGMFEKRKNRQEAEALVKRLVELHREHERSENRDQALSIGIIAMGLGQQECIRDVIQDMQIADPSLEAYFDEDRAEEPLFIKNLENVQGDERDIILISVGYGKNKEGKFFQRFGPINQSVGHRRLNVAFTRARQKIMVFCSFHSHEVKVKSTASAGVRFLRDYLRFAETGHLEAPSLERKAKSHTGIEEQLLHALQAKGFDVVPRLGSSKYRLDLAVRNPRDPKHFVLGIETDGEMYGLAQTARERDRLREDLLRQAGWQLERVWSRDWCKDPIAKVEALSKRIEDLSLAHQEQLKQRKEELEADSQLKEIVLADSLMMVWRQGRWAIEKNGEQIHPPIFDRIDEEAFGKDLFRVWSHRKVGLMNSEGKLLLEPIYDLINPEAIDGGHFLFERKGKYGLFNDRGFVLQEPHFDSIELDFSPEFALVEAEGKNGILSKRSGKLILPPEYDWAGEWQNQSAQLGKDDLIYRLDHDGKLHDINPSVS